ncbi:MAG: NAD(P)-binding protein [Deltaproteobacteria bacterium]|nr:NAD(P)-binding protein [Deltaproteobacteria bacterium]MBI3295903.1 NAD(P)-binding protein [Deltaproteobacteria bacterium]
MTTKRYVIAGAGFRGFCDALELAKIPQAEVTILETAPFFGGVMYSLDVDGFAVDKGVHVFDSIPKSLAEIVNEIMDGKTSEIEFISASAYNGKVTEGFSLPDLNSLDDRSLKDRIRHELLTLAKQGPSAIPPRSLHELFAGRFGQTAGRIYSDIFRKVYGLEASEVEPQAVAQTSLHRLKFLGDEEMLSLKKSDAWLDFVLAARRKSMGKVDDLVSIYPNDGLAMKGWCDRAAPWLESRGIKLCLRETIKTVRETPSGLVIETDKRRLEADHLLWSNDNVGALGASLGIDGETADKFRYGTPMLFIVMMTHATKIRDFTYLQNFDPAGITYRTAAAGIFSHQIRDGISFITSECPCLPSSERWKNAEAASKDAWEEVKHLKIVAPDATLVNSKVFRIPITFKLAKLEYSAKIQEFNERVAKKTRRVVLRNVVPFFRRDIYLDSLTVRGLVE